MQLYADSLEDTANHTESPSPIGGQMQQGTEPPIHALAPRPGRRLEYYALSHEVQAGATMLQLANESGLRAGDLLVLSPGTATEEIVLIAFFGSVHLGFPTRHPHAAGVLVHRADAAPRYPGSGREESFTDPDQQFSEHSSWSSDERAHQKARHMRKQRRRARAATALVAPPPIVTQIRQPERFNAKQIPTVESVNDWEDSMAQEFRLVTGGGEHAEQYLRRAFDIARREKDPEGSAEWLLAFEALQCDHGPYSIPEEKVVAALAEKLPTGMQRRRALLK